MTYDLKITALLWKRASIRCCSVMRALEKQLLVFTEMIQLRSFLVFWRSSSQKYTCQLFLRQMREIFTLSWPRFPETSRLLPNIPDEFPNTSQCTENQMSADVPEDLWAPRRWMGPHFHDWVDYNGVAFSIELLEWGRTYIFGFLGGKTVLHIYG